MKWRPRVNSIVKFGSSTECHFFVFYSKAGYLIALTPDSQNIDQQLLKSASSQVRLFEYNEEGNSAKFKIY